MKAWWCVLAMGATACNGPTIDAGSNDAGATATGAADADGGPQVIASEIQLTPSAMASDGTSVFWGSVLGLGGPIYGVPVTGGTVRTVVSGNHSGDFVAVDDTSVYFWASPGPGIDRANKDGSGNGSALLSSDGGISYLLPTVQGSTLYWLEHSVSAPSTYFLRSMPLQGGDIVSQAEFSAGISAFDSLAVSTSTAFLNGFTIDSSIRVLALGSGMVDVNSLPTIPGFNHLCTQMLASSDVMVCHADTSELYGFTIAGSTVSTATLLAPFALGPITMDDKYVYWVDDLPVGTIQRVPKAGGTIELLARDPNPVAIAVDANAVYWADQQGNIMRLAK